MADITDGPQRWTVTLELPYDGDHEVLAERLEAAAEALKRFSETYLAVRPLDTSPAERERLARAVALIDEAMEQFS